MLAGRTVELKNSALLYYFFATKFHFTPAQVDALDCVLMDKLIFIDSVVQEKNDKESVRLKNG